MKYCLLTSIFVLSIFLGRAQKPALTAKEYDSWNTLKNYKFTKNGMWLVYESTPYRGDGYGVIMKTDSSLVKKINRYTFSGFMSEERFALGVVKPQFDTIRKLEIDKVKKEKWPKDTLVVYDLLLDSTIQIANVIDFKYASFGTWLAYRNQDLAAAKKAEPTTKKKRFVLFKRKKKKSSKDAEPAKVESDGKILTLWNPISLKRKDWDYITSYEFSDSSKYVTLISHEKKKKKDSYVLKIHDLKSEKTVYESPVFTSVGKMAWHISENQFAFLASQDTNANNKHFTLYHLQFVPELKINVLDSAKLAHNEGWIPSNHGQLAFAEDGNRLFFGVAPKPVYEGKDSLTPSEKVKLDLWHWQDTKLQPRQLLSVKKDKNSAFLSYYDWDKDEFQILENDTLKVKLNTKQTRVFLANNDEPHSIAQDYDYPWKQDEYIIAPELGFTIEKPWRNKLGSSFGSVLSPDGKFLVRYQENKDLFELIEIENQKITCLTCGAKINWFEDLNGQIYQSQPEVRIQWTSDRKHILLLTERDVYKIQMDGTNLQRISKGIGEELKQRFDIIRWDEDSMYVDPDRCWLKGFSLTKKESNVYSLNNWMPVLKKNIYANLTSLQTTQDAKLVSYKISTVEQFPDLMIDNSDFSAPKKITDINPQQTDFNWAKVELVQWKTKSGWELEGLLYTPEDLDPNRSYPMIVYYYELNSENIHRHYTPRPTASIVYPTEYCSGGYVIFIPDIRYKPGYPAQSAYECIMSGTDYLLSKYKFIDSTRMGLQGQSWGGYQTAQLITMTTRFKAAMAGAPVSNMFSAYGGIRWGSGMSRQFQYEHSQSRIGFTIWERPDLYTLNSPLFGLPKVKTPLLIMHNDNDGAVPWYQGIELFMGLRRLQKPVLLLNYNGDEHNLMNEAHRKDLSIKMREFFDFYLNNGKMPNWMKDGIKAVDK